MKSCHVSALGSLTVSPDMRIILLKEKLHHLLAKTFFCLFQHPLVVKCWKCFGTSLKGHPKSMYQDWFSKALLSYDLTSCLASLPPFLIDCTGQMLFSQLWDLIKDNPTHKLLFLRETHKQLLGKTCFYIWPLEWRNTSIFCVLNSAWSKEFNGT